MDIDHLDGGHVSLCTLCEVSQPAFLFLFYLLKNNHFNQICTCFAMCVRDKNCLPERYLKSALWRAPRRFQPIVDLLLTGLTCKSCSYKKYIYFFFKVKICSANNFMFEIHSKMCLNKEA